MPESLYRRDGQIINPAESVTEDEAHTSGDPITAIAAVRKDTRGSLSDTDGDYTPLQANDQGELRSRDDDLNTAVGGRTDTPLAVTGDEESATARSGISLWKRAVNFLRGLYRSLYSDGDPSTGTAPGVMLAAIEAALGDVSAGNANHMQGNATSADASGGGMALSVNQADKKIAITDLILSSDVADASFTVQDADGGTLGGPYYPAEHGGFTKTFRSPLCVTTANKDVKVVASKAGTVTATITGYYYG